MENTINKLFYNLFKNHESKVTNYLMFSYKTFVCFLNLMETLSYFQTKACSAYPLHYSGDHQCVGQQETE